MTHMDTHHAWDAEAQLEVVLNNLKIDHLEKYHQYLIGRAEKRVALAKGYSLSTRLLILDEPTNHLDIEMMNGWKTPQNSGVTLFMVTHDRYFLDNICNEIFWTGPRRSFVYREVAAYLEKKKRDYKMKANLDKVEKLFRRELEWMRRMPQARTTKAKSRIDDFTTSKMI